MSKTIVTKLYLQDIRKQQEYVECGARCCLPSGTEYSIQIQIPEVDQARLGNLGNAFTVLGLFSAMRSGGQLHVDAPVCPILRSNLCKFSTAWSQWFPDQYKPVEVTSTADLPRSEQKESRLLVPFSGGLDSCHNLLQLLKIEKQHSSEGTMLTALMVHGFDIPLQDDRAFQVAQSNAREILDSVGVELLSVRCNIRDLPHHWENEHGAALAGCLHLVDRGFHQASIAGSHSYGTLRFPWGSNPLTDPLLSSADLEILYGGLAYARNDKARELAVWPEAMERLRPCWQLSGTGENCGHCVRCIATALNFAAEGIDPPRVLKVGPLSEAVCALDALKLYPAALQRLKDSVLKPARANQIQASWVLQLDALIRKKERRMARKQLRRDLRSVLRDSFK